MMEQETKEILERKFPDKCILERKVQGKKLSYVPHDLVNRRLLEAYRHNGWQYELLDTIQLQEEVVVRVRLGVRSDDGGEWVWKTQFGGARIMYKKETEHVPENMISLADAFKSAMSDGLKKCASLLGVGLHLYGQDEQAALEAGDSPEEPSTGKGGDKPAEEEERTNGGGSASGGEGRPKKKTEDIAEVKVLVQQMENSVKAGGLSQTDVNVLKTEILGNLTLDHEILDLRAYYKALKGALDDR